MKQVNEIRPWPRACIFAICLFAPNLLHPPVNSLQLIAVQAHTVSGFLLTPEIEGVKTYSFFDSF
jgi:hypothetical protein